MFKLNSLSVQDEKVQTKEFCQTFSSMWARFYILDEDSFEDGGRTAVTVHQQEGFHSRALCLRASAKPTRDIACHYEAHGPNSQYGQLND